MRAEPLEVDDDATGGASADLTMRFAILARIAAGLCRDGGIARVEMGRSDRWSWSGATRVLTVGRESFVTLGIEGCAGVIAHEVGHASISRYHLLGMEGLGRGGKQAPGWLNSAEDPRVEAYMSRRYPGVGRWLHRANALLLEAWSPADIPPLRHRQWCLGACIDGNPAGATLAGLLLPEVQETLASTQAARRRYRDDFLPDDDGPGPTAMPDVHRVLCDRHGLDRAVSPREQWVQSLAIAAWTHFQKHIAPEVERLFEADVEEVATLIAGSPPLRLELKQTTTRMPPLGKRLRLARRIWAHRGPGDRPDDEARLLARLWLDHPRLEPTRPAALGVGGATPFLGPVSDRAAGKDHGSGAPVEDASDGDAPNHVSTHPWVEAENLPTRGMLVDRLERVLRDELREQRRAVGRGYANTGVRADLRRVMANEGPYARDPARWQPAWHQAVPSRPDAAFCLLIDCSGSMRGPKIVAAVEAGLVFLEAISTVGAPVFVMGFQDVLIPLARVGASPADASAAIAGARLEVLGRRPGGHNRPGHNDDGPCILLAVEALNAIPVAQRVLVVLTDGLPHGRRSGPAELSAAVARSRRAGIDIIGVGVGPGATHVRDFYPRAVVVERVEGLAQAMVGVLAATGGVRCPPS